MRRIDVRRLAVGQGHRTGSKHPLRTFTRRWRIQCARATLSGDRARIWLRRARSEGRRGRSERVPSSRRKASTNGISSAIVPRQACAMLSRVSLDNPQSMQSLHAQRTADPTYCLTRWRTERVPGCTARRISSRYVGVELICAPVLRVNVKVPGLFFSM
jgi:hypothetical protein